LVFMADVPAARFTETQPTAGADPPLILLPGMAADARLFRFQRRAFPSLLTPDWIEPDNGEPLIEYARRFARRIAPLGGCFVGGASFGGIVALEMAADVQAEACFLVSSVRSDSEFPWRYQALRPITRFGPNGLRKAAAWSSRWLAPLLPAATVGRLRRFSEPRSAFVRWATWAVLSWRASVESQTVRVYQIHGSVDQAFPARRTRPDVLVAGAGHVLVMTHAEVVNEFIRARLSGHRSQAQHGGAPFDDHKP
jgi:pimeloyl-ACP methyl ester carboxylesterase